MAEEGSCLIQELLGKEFWALRFLDQDQLSVKGMNNQELGTLGSRIPRIWAVALWGRKAYQGVGSKGRIVDSNLRTAAGPRSKKGEVQGMHQEAEPGSSSGEGMIADH
jgi:hypothetical protein